jgi:hypothetical protein
MGSYNKFLKLKKKPALKTNLNYSLKFISIITPGAIQNIRLLFQLKKNNGNIDENKLLVKQSYILLTWIAYIEKSNKLSKSLYNGKKPSFSVQPVKKKMLTLLKAPMAHKTFSQEQYVFKFYQLNVSYKNEFNYYGVINSINKSVFLSLNLRLAAIPFETNLLFLKKFRFSFVASDKIYMNLNTI